MTPDEIEIALDITLQDYQEDPIDQAWAEKQGQVHQKHRSCLYYKTGAGKSITSLSMIAVMEYDEVLVIAPPSTHVAWAVLGEKLGIQVETISHAKFRQKNYKISRSKPIIADEFHLFGGHGGTGWKKFESASHGVQAPIIMCSATPNYNDAERVYCIQRILDKQSTKGGYLEFIARECETEVNQFSMVPKVLGFRNYPGAPEYLAALPGVYYLPDDAVYSIVNVPFPAHQNEPLDLYGYDLGKQRIMASQIEEKHTRIYNDRIRVDSPAHKPALQDAVWTALNDIFNEHNPFDSLLIYCNHSSIARVLYAELQLAGFVNSSLVTGNTSARDKEAIIQRFRMGDSKVLIGTATLATGTDGLDKVCDSLIIFDDTEDDALRRQLIGRILPRGIGNTNASKKRVWRLVAT